MDRVSRKALFDERVDIDAEVDPLVSDDHVVWDSGMHLVGNDLLGSIREH